MLSHDPCFGVSTYWNRFGHVARKARVSFEMCAEWLSRTSRMVQSAGYQRVQVFQQVDEFAAAVPPFDTGGYMTVVQVQRRQDRASAQPLVFVIATDRGMFTGNGRQIRSGIGEGLQTRFLIH